jgi:hypothetical protein
MKRKPKSVSIYSYGLISFCERKQINIKETVDLFITTYNLTGTAGKQDIIDKNWKKFAAFVNEKLLKKEIKGVNVSTSNGSEEEKSLRIQLFKQYPIELRIWWDIVKSKAEWATTQQTLFQRFFHVYNLGVPPKKDDGHQLNIGKNIPRFEAIRDNHLMEEFKNFKDF